MSATKNFLSKKVIVVSILAIGAVSAILVASSMIAQATAQQQQQTMMWMRGAGQGTMMTTMPEIKGSVSVANETAGFISENLKVPFDAAAKTAQEQVANGTVLGGHVGVVQGYLVYTFFVVDTSNQTAGHLVIVDAGNGQALYTSEGHPLGSSFGPMSGHWGGGPGFGGWWGGPWKGHGFGWGMWH
jgi:uncharacterized membrane protein YkoI